MDESQFILRLPDQLVERMRFALSSNKNKNAAGEDKKVSKFGIEFKDTRNATFTVDGESYPAYLMDLPCIVETHKTADKRTFFKSGDLHQVLVVRMPGERAPTNPRLPHGLTPAARDAASRMADPPRIFPPKQVESVEQRIKYVLDHKVTFVAKKNDPPPPEEEEEVLEIEEEVPATATAETSTVATANANKPSAAKPPLQPQQSPSPMEDLQSVATPLLSPPMTVASPSVFDPSPAPDTQTMTPELATPLPDGEDTPADTANEQEGDGEADDEGDDEDDDFAEMADALMEEDEEEEAKKRIERANFDQKITDKKKEIEDLENRANRAPNPVLKNRILAKRGDLTKELEQLEKGRAELGDKD